MCPGRSLGRRCRDFALAEQGADDCAACIVLANNTADRQHTGFASLDFGLDLVSLDHQYCIAYVDLASVGYQPFADGAVGHREPKFGHGELVRHSQDSSLTSV